MGVWKEWASQRNSKSAMEAERIKQLDAYVPCNRIRQNDSQECPPQSLYQLCCSLQRAACFAGLSSLNLFEDSTFKKL